MAAPMRSSSTTPARIAILLGSIGLLAIPASVAFAAYAGTVDIVNSVILAVPVAVVLALAALSAARRARYRYDRSVFKQGGRTLKTARVVVWTALYVGTIGALSVGVFEVLRLVSKSN